MPVKKDPGSHGAPGDASLMVVGARPPLTGRERELGRLRRLLADLEEGRGSAALILGHAGTGKSALLYAFVDEALSRGSRVSIATADPLDPRPLGPLIDAFAEAPDVSMTLTRLEETGGPTGLELAVDPLLDAIERRPGEPPSVLVIEDLHAAGQELTTFLSVLAQRIQVSGALLVATSRPSESNGGLADLARVSENYDALVHLRDLDEAAQAELAAAVLGAPAGERLRRLLKAVGGNPLHLVEVIRDLVREESLTQQSRSIELNTSSLPRPLRRTVESRLEMASPRTRSFIETASIFGTSFFIRDVARSIEASLPDVLPAVHEGIRLNLFSADEPTRFPHDLLRDAVYDQIPPTIRAELHLEIARRSAEAGHMDIALGHLRNGPSRVDQNVADELVTHTLAAADSAPAMCAEVLEELLRLAPIALAERTDVKLTLARLKIWSGKPSEAVSITRDLLSEVDLPVASQISSRLVLGEALTTTWAWTEDDRRRLEEMTELGVLLPTQRAEALVQLAYSHRGVEDLPAAGALARQALEIAQPEEKFADIACRAYDLLAGEALVRVQLPQVLLHADRALQLAPLAGRNVLRLVQPHYVSGLAHFYADRLDDAEAVWKEGLRFNERSGTRWAGALFDMNFANIQLARGRLDDAEAQLDLILQDAGEVGTAWYPTEVARERCRIALLKGDVKLVDNLIAAVVKTSDERVGTPMNLAWILGARAAVSGDPLTALDQWDRALAIAEGSAYDFRLRWLSPPYVQLAVQAGRMQEAEAVARNLASVCQRMGSPWAEAMGASAVALVERDRSLAERAVDTLRGTQRVLDLALALENLAIVTKVADPAASTRSREEAASVYDTYGAVWEAQRLRGDRLSSRRKPTRPTHGWRSLTPTENRVATLVTEGLTYRQVADELFISRRTVESHIAKVFQKLHISSRGELAMRARERATETAN